MFWLNVSKPTGMWKLHKSTCRFCSPQETRLKGVNQMKEFGGWFEFKTPHEALVFYNENKALNSIWQPCRICNQE
ncbi:hypothetical protein ACFL0D_07605 [Thermoproteota archaeon]